MESCLALIAHDARQHEMVDFAVRHAPLLRRCALVATEATGRLLENEVGLRSERLGPDGHFAARVVMGEVDAVVFLAGAIGPGGGHELRTMLRVCRLHDIPLATNVGGADRLMHAMGGETSL